MNNYSLTAAGLTTDDRQIKVMFRLEDVAIVHPKTKKLSLPIVLSAWRVINQAKVCIPYPVVLSAIQPVEGEGFVYHHEEIGDEVDLTVMPSYRKTLVPGCFHKKVLNIVTTRSELRELIERCQEAKG